MDWLSLSWWGMQRYMYWEPVTFLFTQHTGGSGINLFFLLTLFFNMYVLWVFGSHIYQRVGKNPFLRFYFISGILAGIIAFLLMPVTGQYGIISGATPSILAIMIVWTLMNPEAELLLFFLIPVKAKWLSLGIVGAIVLINLSNADLVSFTLFFSAALIGYFYGLVIWGLHSPFTVLHKFELAVLRFSSRIQKKAGSLVPKRKAKKPTKKGTVVDVDFTVVKPGKEKFSKEKNTIVKPTVEKPVTDNEDDRFIDSMLEKISKFGQHSLTWQERERMKEISEKRRKDNYTDTDVT
jgi:hypothetical protein